jgi:hypothetical protein
MARTVRTVGLPDTELTFSIEQRSIARPMAAAPRAFALAVKATQSLRRAVAESTDDHFFIRHN